MATLNEEVAVDIGSTTKEEITSTEKEAIPTTEAPVSIEPSESVTEKEVTTSDSTSIADPEPAAAVESTTDSNSGKDEGLKTALNALFQGKRHLLVKDLPHAISSLGEACRLLGEVKGTLSMESGEAHYYYGKALLELARSELSVIDAPGGIPEEDDEDDEEDEEDEKEEEEEAEEANGKAGEKEEGKESKEVEEATAEVAEAEEDISAPSPKVEAEAEIPVVPATNGTSSTNGTVLDGEKPSTSTGKTGTEAENDEEPSNLELAWEVLEVAKITYITLLERTHLAVAGALEASKTEQAEADPIKDLKELQDRLASTHLLLGEVATEGEQYSAAEEDFRTALNIFRDIESPDSRKIAQSYFQLGIAFAFDKKFVEAISSFEKAAELIELRISNLTTLIANKESEEYKALDEPEQEVEELKLLLPEMKEKIVDTKDAQMEALKTQEEEKMEQEIILRNSPIKNPNPPAANDISHLVKKKKKAEEEHELEPPKKKVCAVLVEDKEPTAMDTEPDTTGTTNGNSNGHAILEDTAPTSTTSQE